MKSLFVAIVRVLFTFVRCSNVVCVTNTELIEFSGQARREPQRGPGKHSRGAPNIYTGPLWEENFWIFLFKIVHYGVLYISGRRRAPRRRGGRGSLSPLPHPLDGPVSGYIFTCTKGHKYKFGKYRSLLDIRKYFFSNKLLLCCTKIYFRRTSFKWKPFSLSRSASMSATNLAFIAGSFSARYPQV